MRLFDRQWANLGVICVLFVALAPYLWMIATAFKTPVDALSSTPVWIFPPTLQNFNDAFVSGPFLAILGNSLIVSVGSVAVALVLAVPAAYVLSRYDRMVGGNHLFFFVLTTRMAPEITVAVPIFLLYTKFVPLYDTYVGLIVVTTLELLAFALWITKTFFDGIPRALDEAALMSGCTRLQAFYLTVLPAAKSGVAAAAIFCLLFAWSESFFSMLLASQSGVLTLPNGIQSLVTPAGTTWGEIAAVSAVLTVPMVIFAFLVMRHLVQGLNLGMTR